MNKTDPEFIKILETITKNANNYVLYSPTQVARGEHLIGDPTSGERSWSIPKTTGEFLYTLITKLGLCTGLELGTSIGYSTFWIAAALHENSPNYTLTTVERNPEKSMIAKETLLPYFPQIYFHSGIINHFLPTLPDTTTFDFIFMDADRGNYMFYWESIKTYMHAKSIVVTDNALREQKSVQDFQNHIMSDSAFVTYLHPLDNGLFIIVRSDGDYVDLGKIINTL